MVFNRTDSTWENIGLIKSLTNDKMILVSKWGRESIFLRHSNKSDSTNIDAIALSSSGCFGTCPIVNIIIESNGNVTFYGERYVDKLGFYEGQISKENFLKISDEFSKAGIETLDQNFAVGHTDDERSLQLLFLKIDLSTRSRTMVKRHPMNSFGRTVH